MNQCPLILERSLAIDFPEATHNSNRDIKGAARVLNAALAILDVGEDLLGSLSRDS